jgi:putative FmdB family regulatory protein
MEVFQKMSDKPPVKCRKCGGRLERKISAPAIQFKGSGWYVTDYAAKDKSKATKSEKSESESSAEAKPDKTDKKSKESSPAKKTSDKASSPKASTGD